MYMLDTNVFNYFLENNISIEVIKEKGALYTTNVQFSELSNNSNIEIRDATLNIYEALDLTKLMLESGLWLDNLRWDDSQIWHSNVGEGFRDMLGNSRGHYDAMIGEVVINHNLTLVTNDGGFRNRAGRNNINVLTVEEFLEL